jgi:hypothetical protein
VVSGSLVELVEIAFLLVVVAFLVVDVVFLVVFFGGSSTESDKFSDP